MPDSLWEQDDFTDLVANKKEFIKDLNLSRDWVEHANGEHAEEMDIEDPHAHFSVQRAVNAYRRLVVAGIAPRRQSLPF